MTPQEGALPPVTVVIETITARYDAQDGQALADELTGTIAALDRQTYPHDLIETIVVLDPEVPESDVTEVKRRYPSVTLVQAPAANYFAAKNAGANAAHGAIVVLLDGDCEAAADWLEKLVSPFETGVAVVTGCTRYSGPSRLARTFSVSDFGTVLEHESGGATGIMLNNVAFRRDVLLHHPLDTRIRRNGGCFLLYHQLRAAGARIIYEPRAEVSHGLDIRGLGYVRKHFDRGYDGVGVYRLDAGEVLRGTRSFRRFGGAVLLPLTLRRVALDWVRLARHRRQVGISVPALPYFALVILGTRLIELVGAIVAVLDRRQDAPGEAERSST